MQQKIFLLQHELVQLRRAIYGAKSERHIAADPQPGRALRRA